MQMHKRAASAALSLTIVFVLGAALTPSARAQTLRELK